MTRSTPAAAPTASSAATATTSCRATASRSTIFGGNGNDEITLASGKGTTTIDAGPGDDTIEAVTASGRGTVKCGAGDDTVLVSRFPGNRKRVKVAADCEHKKKV